MAQLSIDYRVPGLPGLAVDCVASTRGSRPASVDNRVQIGGYSTLDVGAHYKIPIGHPSMTLRVQVLNVTDRYNWYVGSDGGLSPLEPRRALAYLVSDF
jgi:iron complex outermembrane recepter protein